MNPPLHPGAFITATYLEPHGIKGRALAAKLGVSPSMVCRLLQGSCGISPLMALRLSKAIGNSAESWLAMQGEHDLWIAREHPDLQQVGQLPLEPKERRSMRDRSRKAPKP